MWIRSLPLNFRDDRGVTPVVGVIFMLSVVVIVAAIIGTTAYGNFDTVSDPAPQVEFDIKETESGVEIRHSHGDSISGDQIKLVGDVTTDTIPDWEGETVSAGDSATVVTTGGELELLFEADSGSESYRLKSSSVPDTATTVDFRQIMVFGESHNFWTGSFDLRDIEIDGAEDDTLHINVVDGGEADMEDGESQRISSPEDGHHIIRFYESDSKDYLMYECEFVHEDWESNGGYYPEDC